MKRTSFLAVVGGIISSAVIQPAGAQTFVLLGDLPGGEVRSSASALSANGEVVLGISSSADGWEAFRWTPASGMVGLGGVSAPPFYTYAELCVSADGAVVAGAGSDMLIGPCDHTLFGEEGFQEWFHTSGGAVYEAFRWTRESATTIGLGFSPGHCFSWAAAISADGTVIVGYSQSFDESEAFRWTTSTGLVPLVTWPLGCSTYYSCWSAATGVSADGSVVVGRRQDSAYLGPQAFRWTPSSGMVVLDNLVGANSSSALAVSVDGSVVVGESGYAAEWWLFPTPHAVRWTSSGGIEDLGDASAGFDHSSATLVSHDGSVIVGLGYSGAYPEVFRWESGVMTGLGNLPAYSTNPQASATYISADGAVVAGVSGGALIGDPYVGWYYVDVPFLWDAHRGMRTVQDVLEIEYGLDLLGRTVISVDGLSADGKTLAGTCIIPGAYGFEAFWAKLTNTPLGAGVWVDLNGGSAAAGGATVTFFGVGVAGETTITIDPGRPDPPPNFKIGARFIHYNISTTADYTGPVTVCINYSDILPEPGEPPFNEDRLKLFHYEAVAPGPDGVLGTSDDAFDWVPACAPGADCVDEDANVICGTVSSLSPFAIFLENQAPVITCNGPVVLWSPNHELIDAGAAFSVSDPDGDAVTLSIRVFSDETEVPETGDGTGKHAPDFKNELFPGGRGLLVRSERRNPENGRFYIFVVTADDGGAVTTKAFAAAVCPHDQNQPSLDSVLAQAAGAAQLVQETVDVAGTLPPVGLYEHGLAAPLGPHQ